MLSLVYVSAAEVEKNSFWEAVFQICKWNLLVQIDEVW